MFLVNGKCLTLALSGGLNDLWRYNITSGMWAWLNGGSAVDQNAVFNTINVESSTTNPGSAYEHGLAINPSQDMIYQFGSFRRITGIDGQFISPVSCIHSTV